MAFTFTIYSQCYGTITTIYTPDFLIIHNKNPDLQTASLPLRLFPYQGLRLHLTVLWPWPCRWSYLYAWPPEERIPGLPWLLSITNSWSLINLMSMELVMPSNHFILCHPLLLPPSIFPSIRVFSNESALLIRWPKYWSFSFSHQSSQWICRVDFL